MTGLPVDAAPATALRLARLHLRTGMLRLARLELEQLAGAAALDTEGILDLAEVRWRTGDLRGAAEAAGAWLDAGAVGAAPGGADPDAPQVLPAGADPDLARAADRDAPDRSRALAHAIVAEGLAVRGRHDDASLHVMAALDALAGRAGGTVEADLDGLFAGIPARSDAWPAFAPGVVPDDLEREPATGAARRPARRPAERTAGERPEAQGGEPALAPSTGPSADGTMADVAMTDEIIAAAAERLRAGDDTPAAVLLLLALRATPARAGEILQRADAALAARPGSALLLARAEALQALGRTEAAAIAYAVADAHARRGEAAPPPALGPGAPGLIDAPPAAPDAAPSPDPDWSSP
jgi:hypothetical protein